MTLPTYVGGIADEKGASTTITYSIDFTSLTASGGGTTTVADNDVVLVMICSDASNQTFNPGPYNTETWTLIAGPFALGSRAGAIYGRVWHTGDSKLFQYRKSVANADGIIAVAYRGVDWANLIVGTGKARSAAPADTSLQTTALSLTTTKADTKVLAVAMEATSASETGSFLTGPTVPSGWTQDFYRAQTTTINTIEVAHKDMAATGASGNATFTYQNTQASNGYGIQLALPGFSASNVAPSAGFSYVAEDLDVQFTDTSSDSDGTIASRSWNFGDGATSTATNPSHIYDQPGTYTVSLTVTDNGGATNSTSQSVTVTGISAYEWEVARASWKEAVIQIRSTANVDTRIQQVDYVMGQGYSLTQQLAWYAQGKKMFVAHRGLSLNYPEETAYAYWAACVLGYQALEISVQKSASGTFWCFHDSTTDRTTGVSGTISSMTDTQLSALNNLASSTDVPTQPVRPVAKLVDLLAIYGGKRLIFIEDKTYANTAAILNLMDTYGGTDWFVWKQAGPGSAFLGQANRGYKSWGYFFDTDMAGSFASKQAQWDFVGLDYASSDATLDSAIATAGASRVIGHIIANATNRDRFLTRGVRGLMVSNAHAVTPVVS